MSALSIIERKLPVPARAVFDLIAWTGEQAAKLDGALVEAGSMIRDAKIIPAIPVEGADTWSSLSAISVWPEGQFSILKASDVARYVGANLVSYVLDHGRLARLATMAGRLYLTLTPSPVSYTHLDVYKRQRFPSPRTFDDARRCDTDDD